MDQAKVTSVKEILRLIKAKPLLSSPRKRAYA